MRKRGNANHAVEQATRAFFESPSVDAQQRLAAQRWRELFGNDNVADVFAASKYEEGNTLLEVIDESGIEIRGVSREYLEEMAPQFTVERLRDHIVNTLNPKK